MRGRTHSSPVRRPEKNQGKALNMDRRNFIRTGVVAATAAALSGVTKPLSAQEASDKKENRTLRVLLVNGSPRKNGNTATSLAEAAKSLKAAGIETEDFWIGTKAVHGCIACSACGRLHRCVFEDDPCNELLEKIRAADGLIVGAPVYYGQPNGGLLALLQRALNANPGGVSGKPVACLAVCRRGGSTASVQCLNMPFEMLDCLLVGSQYWNIAYGLAPGEAAKDVEGMQTMRRMGANMAWVLKNLHSEGATPIPPRERFTPMHFIR